MNGEGASYDVFLLVNMLSVLINVLLTGAAATTFILFLRTLRK